MTDTTLVKIVSPITTVTVTDKINVVNVKDQIAVATIGTQGPAGTPGGMFVGGFTTVSTDYLITLTDREWINVDASLEPLIITLDNVANFPINRSFTIKKIDSTENWVSVETSDGELLDFDIIRTLELPGEAIKIATDGIQWWIR